MTIDREFLAQTINEVADLKEHIREVFLRAANPGLPAVFRELQMAVRCLEDAENLLDGLVVTG